MILTREALEAAAAKRDRRETVELSGIDGAVIVRSIRADRFLSFARKNEKAFDGGALSFEGEQAPAKMAELIALALVDNSGELLFQPDEGPRILEIFPPTDLAAIANAVMRVCNFQGDASVETNGKKKAEEATRQPAEKS